LFESLPDSQLSQILKIFKNIEGRLERRVMRAMIME